MNGILAIGSAGMRSAMVNLQASAGRVARIAAAGPAAGTPNLAVEAVTQVQARYQFIAHAKVVKTADAMLGTLVDTFA
ncbi:MAG: hypothetical protein AMXMBFR78_15600 [Rubrivivax sp.]|jgi:hypothetical protein